MQTTRTATRFAIAVLALSAALAGCASSAPGPASSSDSAAEGDSFTATIEAIHEFRKFHTPKHDGYIKDERVLCRFEADMPENSRVTIKDSTGKMVAVSDFSNIEAIDFTSEQGETSYYGHQGTFTGTCRVSLETTIESSDDFFTIEVDGRSGSIDVTRAELERGLTLK